MSRLDDELKIAFRREPAPAGFTDKVLARLAHETRQGKSPHRARWWRAVLAWFDSSNMRLIQVGVAILLFVLIAAVAYRLTRHAPQEPVKQAVVTPKPDGADAPTQRADDTDQKSIATNDSQQEPQAPKRQRRRELRPSSEAEAAKEQVMLALYVASSTLNDMQRSVQEGDNHRKTK